MKLTRIAVVLSFTLGASAFAANYARDNFRDIRWEGRGNAGLAMVDDGTALFYNPAGLAHSETYGVEFVNPAFGANQNFVGSISQLSTLTSGSQTLSEKFSPFLGRPLGLQASFFPHVHVPGFALGVWDYADLSVAYRNPVNPQLDLETRNDYGVILGGAWAYQKLLYFGASIRYQKRKQLFDSLTAGSILAGGASQLNSLIRNGGGLGFNLGMQARYDFEKQFLALGVTVEDLGMTVFKNSAAEPDLQRQIQMLNLGAAYGYDTALGGVHLLFDIRQYTNHAMDLTKKLQMGVEANVLMLETRLGLFQGYWTAGLSIYVLPALSFDFATYGEELDAVAGQRFNRYWMMGMRFGLDLKPKTKVKKQRYILQQN